MNNTDTLLKILDEGAFVTHEEMAEIAREMRALQQDAERYRWLTKYTAHLFMCTEKGLDEQMNRAMGKGGK
jgi:sulfur transfer protein SufE